MKRMKSVLAGCLLLVGVGACATDARAIRGGDSALADSLKQLIAEAYDFSKPDVAERMYALYDTTGPVVSASGGKVVASTDSLRRGIVAFWENVGRNMREPVWTWGDVHVERLAEDVAVLTGTWSIPHTAPTDRPHVILGAWTAVFRRSHDGWRIVHEHLSVPQPAADSGG